MSRPGKNLRKSDMNEAGVEEISTCTPILQTSLPVSVPPFNNTSSPELHQKAPPFQSKADIDFNLSIDANRRALAYKYQHTVSYSNTDDTMIANKKACTRDLDTLTPKLIP